MDVNPTLRNVVLEVYLSVWEEYSEWSELHNASTLKSLEAPRCSFNFSIPIYLEEADSTDLPDDSDLKFSVSELNPDGSTIDEYVISTYVVTVDQALRAHSPYESCTPITRNLMVGDDPDVLPFIPFGDDPTYDHRLYAEEHSYFRWHKLFVDPDIEVVACKTFQILTKNHGMKPADIDKAEILPLLHVDLINLPKQRDFPKWALKKPTIKYSDVPEKIMDYFLTTFCNNLNCITGFCATHLETQTPSFNYPRISYHRLGDAVAHPCGLQCFLYPPMDSTSIASATLWTADDTQILFTILTYAPDASSCDLAIMCRKHCREVHTKRASYQLPAKQMERGKNISTQRNYEESAKFFTPQLPCKHSGHCNLQSECSCLLNNAHCHTRCECGKTCQRRWKGCTCATSKIGKVCGTKKCSCFRANVECDPEVCIPCEAKNQNSNLCKNVSIQRGISKQTEVRKGNWGLGLFVLESCEKGEMVAEYVGELIYEPTLRSRDLIATHRKRSYVFVLNPTFAVDSTYAGNSTRYINHSPDPNCNAKVCLVNGEHRIGIYAARRIRRGEELFIDYGPLFFKDQAGTSVNAEGPLFAST